MKGQKTIIPGLLISLIGSVSFIGIGLKTMIKYSNDPANWHFIAALIGTLGFVALSGICLLGFYTGLSSEQFQKKNFDQTDSGKK